MFDWWNLVDVSKQQVDISPGSMRCLRHGKRDVVCAWGGGRHLALGFLTTRHDLEVMKFGCKSCCFYELVFRHIFKIWDLINAHVRMCVCVCVCASAPSPNAYLPPKDTKCVTQILTSRIPSGAVITWSALSTGVPLSERLPAKKKSPQKKKKKISLHTRTYKKRPKISSVDRSIWGKL